MLNSTQRFESLKDFSEATKLELKKMRGGVGVALKIIIVNTTGAILIGSGINNQGKDLSHKDLVEKFNVEPLKGILELSAYNIWFRYMDSTLKIEEAGDSEFGGGSLSILKYKVVNNPEELKELKEIISAKQLVLSR